MEFQDRVSAYPNRYILTTQDGTASYIILERADEPIIPGTPLNAETFNTMFGGITPDSIGAAEYDHTHTPASIGAAKASHSHDEYCENVGTSWEYLPPVEEDIEYCSKIISREVENDSRYDVDGDGLVMMSDMLAMRQVMLGINDMSTLSNAELSEVTVTVDPSNPNRIITIEGTNMWGSTVELSLGIKTLLSMNRFKSQLDALASRVAALEAAAQAE